MKNFGVNHNVFLSTIMFSCKIGLFFLLDQDGDHLLYVLNLLKLPMATT